MKGKKSVLIFAIILMVISASLATALGLFLTGALKTDPVKIVLTIKDETKVYDGTPLKPKEYVWTEGELAEGETVEVDYVGEQTEVGTSKSDLVVKILDETGYNVSKNYSIKVETGTLNVTKRVVDIVLPTQQVVYSGSTVEFSNYQLAEGSTTELVKGHKIYGSRQNGLLQVGDQLPSDLMPLVFDVSGNDVSGNYEIAFAMGKIEIVPRELVVRPVSYSKIYDGTPLTVKDVDYVSGSLVTDQYATYTINNGNESQCALTDVGKIATQVTDFRIYQRVNGEAVDVTSNYRVDKTEKGALEVTPRKLVLKPASLSKVYDGLAASIGVENVVGTLADGQYAEYELTDGTNTVTTVKNAGDYTIGLKNVHIKQYGAEGAAADVTENYDITATLTGEVKITPRALTVTAKNGTWQYDGQTHSLIGDTKPLSASGLADGDSVASVTYSGEISGVGEEDNVIESVTLSCHNDNYTINAVSGTLKITPCEIIIRTETKEKYYDTEPLSGRTVTVEKVADGTSGLPVSTHTVSLVGADANFPAITNAGTVTNRVPLTVTDGENNVAGNYAITYEWGTLTVKKMPVIATLATDGEAVYDGTSKRPAIEDSVTVSSVSEECTQTLGEIFSATEKLELVTYVKNMVDADEYSYSVGFKDSADALNYSLEVKNTGYFTINPMPITVTLKSYTNKPYTTRRYSLEMSDAIVSIKDADNNDVTIIGKDEFTAVCDTDLTSVGSHAYSVKIKDRSNPDNFSLTTTNGAVEIISAAVTVTLKSYTDDNAFYYTGSAIEPDMDDAIESISSDVLKKSDFVLDVAEPIVNAQTENYKYKVKIKDANIAANVNFTSPEQNLKVNKANATVVLNDISTVYNGEEYALNPLTAVVSVDGGTAPLALSDINLKYYATGSRKNVNTYKYGATIADGKAANYALTVKNAKSGNTATSDSSVGKQIAAVKITQFPLTVTSDSLNITYDGAAHKAEGFSYLALANPNHMIGLNSNPVKVTDITYDEDFGTLTTVKNEQDYIIREGATNVTNNYKITKISGTIVINPREITVTTATKSFIYDGTAQKACDKSNDVSVDNLVAGHDFEITTAANKQPKVQYVSDGYISNELEIDIKSGSNSVAKNYKIKYNYGKLNVVRRPIEITTGSQSKKYDGTELKLGTPTASAATTKSGLISGHTVEAATPAAVPSITDVGKIRNEFVCYLKDGSGRDVTGNYDVTYNYGMLEIKKLTVTINRKSLTATTALTYNGAVQNPAIDELITIAQETGVTISSDLLPKTYDFDLAFYNASSLNSAVKDAGTYSYNITPKSYLNSGNFLLQYTGTPSVVVNPKAVEVTLATLTPRTYNGKDQTPAIDKIIYSLTQNGTAGALEKSDFVATFSDDVGHPSVLKDAGKYTYKVALGSDVLESNYSITFKDGNSRRIDVNQKSVTISTRDVYFTYNGQAHTINPEDVITIDSGSAEILPLSEFKINVDGDLTIKDARPNNGSGYGFSVGLDNHNFKLSGTSSAMAYVYKLNVTVTHHQGDFVYDGVVHTLRATDALSFDSDLVKATDVNISGLSTIKDAGTYSYSVAFKDATLENNITLQNKNGQFTIKPYVVSGSLKNYTRDYDGNVYTVDVADALTVDKSLLKGSFTVATTPAVIKNAADYTYTVSYTPADGEVAENFDMTAVTNAVGKVKVNKLAVGATLYNFDDFVYNGEPRNINKAFAITLNTSLVTASDFNIVAYTAESDGVTVKDADEYLYRIQYNKADAGNFDFTAAYAARGRVKISPLPVTVTLNDVGKTYDGTTLTVNTDNLTIDTTLLNKSDFTVNNPYHAEVNAGNYSYTASYTGTDKPAKNFIFTYRGGNITISPIDVTISLADFPASGSTFTYNGSNYRDRLTMVTMANAVTAPGVSGVSFTFDIPTEMKNAGTYTYKVAGYTGDARNYNFVNLDTAVGHVTVLPKDITLEFKDGQTRAYNGNPYTINLSSQSVFDLQGASTTDYAALIGGFKVAEGTPEMINAGTYTYRVVYTGDEASNYNFVNIGSARGTVEITPKPVTVTLSDFTRTYNGQAFTVPVDTAVVANDDGLLGGSFRLAAGTPEMKNVKRSASDNSVTYYEYSVNYVGSDKGNFAFTYSGSSGTKGRVTISPFAVGVQLADFTQVYDGQAFSVPLASALTTNTNLMTGGWNIKYVDGAALSDANNMKYAGTYSYAVQYAGTDADNFNLTAVENARGTVRIRPVSVTVTLPDVIKTYDGNKVTGDSISTNHIKISSDLLERGKILIGKDANAFEFKDAGEYSYVDKITLSMGDAEKKSFHITYEGGNVKINAVNISVTLPNVVKTYDGQAVTIDKTQVLCNSEFFNAEKLTINVQGSDETHRGDYVDAGEYNYISKVSYGTAEEAASKNINIEYLGGKITINPLAVKITLKNYNKIYDGTAITITQDDITTSSTLVPDGSFNLSGDLNVTNAGEYNYSVTYNNYEVPETNFTFTYDSGSIVIKPFDLTVNLLTVNKTYNGKYFVKDQTLTDPSTYAYKFDESFYTVSPALDKLPAADRENLKVDFVGLETDTNGKKIPPRFPGVYSFEAKFEGEGVQQNYNFNVVGEGKLTVSKWKMTVTLKDLADVTYNGSEVEIKPIDVIPIDEIEIPKDADNAPIVLITHFDIVPNKTILNAGSYTYTAVLNNNDSGYALNNVELTVVNEGHITVNKKTVTVNLATDKTGAYTGLPQYVTGDFATIEGVATGASATAVTQADFRVKYSSSMVDAGTYKYTAELINNSLATNYDFVIGEGTYTITKATVAVSVNDFEFVYSGKPVSVEIGAAISNLNTETTGATPLTNGDLVISSYSVSDLTNVGNITYYVDFASSAIARNYQFTATSDKSGTIKITKRKVSFVCADYVATAVPTESTVIDLSGLISLSSTLGDGDALGAVTATGKYDPATATVTGTVTTGLNMNNYEYVNKSTEVENAAVVKCRLVVVGDSKITFTVALNPNHDSFGASQVTVEQGKTVYETLHGTTDGSKKMTPERTDYTFLGWFTEAEAGEQVDLSTLTIDKNVTLYAHWQQNETYTVTFDLNYEGAATPTKKTVKFVGETLDYTGTPTRDGGYTFDGWYTAKDGGTKVENLSAVKGSQTLYAHWAPPTT